MTSQSPSLDKVLVMASTTRLMNPTTNAEISSINGNTTTPLIMATKLSALDEFIIAQQNDSAGQLANPSAEQLETRNCTDGTRIKSEMVNIPEHDNNSMEPNILQLGPLTKYVSTSDYMTNPNLDFQTRFNSPLNSLEIFNPVEFAPSCLPGVMNLPVAANDSLVQNSNLRTPLLQQEPARVSAYAKLIFEDGYFYMNTYSVVLGRDLKAWHAAIRKEKRRQKQLQNSGGHTREPETPVCIKREGSRYSRSIVSESGGMLRAENDSDVEERMRWRRLRNLNKVSKKTKSTGSSSPGSRKNCTTQSCKAKVYEAQNLQSTISRVNGPIPVDLATFRPSPHDCPLVAIHPPATAPISAYKSISREHVKIAFNCKKSYFEAHVIGRNGCFVQDQWYQTSDIVPLNSGDFLQVGGITVQFMLPNQLDPTSVEYSDYSDEDPNSEECTPIDTNERKKGDFIETSDDESASSCDDIKALDSNMDRLRWDKENDVEISRTLANEKRKKKRLEGYQKYEADEIQNEAIARNVSSNISLNFVIDKKRGPGRPPKNGILSKREQKLLKKEEQALFEAMVKEGVEATKEQDIEKDKIKGKGKALIPEIKPKPRIIEEAIEDCDMKIFENSTEKINLQQPGVPVKNKVGRPRKNPLPDNLNEPPREKRKYTKRKPKEPREPKDVDGNGSGSGEDAKAKKEKVSQRPPRSPSPVMNEADYTPEQLAKPQANYLTLIHEALSNAPCQQLGLPEIYRAIYRKYPYFKFKTQTLGWQSSVRHNLSQHKAFRKVEKDGKGWTWGIVDGVSIERDKKRRATPPPQTDHSPLHHQPTGQSGQTQMMGHYSYGLPVGLHTQSGQFSNYQLPSSTIEHSSNTSLPSNFIPSIPPHLTAPNVSTSYNSPYAPKSLKTESSSQTIEPSETMEQKTSDKTSSSVTGNNMVIYPNMDSQEKSNGTCPKSPSVEQSVPQIQAKQTTEQVLQVSSLQPQELPPVLSVNGLNNSRIQKSIAPSPQQISQSQTLSQIQKPSQVLKSKQSLMPSNLIHTSVNEDVIRAAESFKKNLLDSLKSKQSEIIVNSAVNRVLGIVSQNESSGNPQEEMIMTALKSLLSKIPGSKIEADKTYSVLSQLNSQSSEATNLSQQSIVQNIQNSTKTPNCDETALAVTRPNFTVQGHGRLNTSAVTRPPMSTSGSKAVHSDNSSNTPRKSIPSSSPALTSSSVNDASITKPPSKEIEQLAGQKRTHDETEDVPEFKRLSTSGPLQLKI
ncbi:Transcriptional activator [Golovinomyces cichoracearum]|uniref:Transcriptional activator n=1 Tax=Golovinomyces cichoracearum TaxID=62708 RepID=A0A420HMK3_9PEZI|nr:Transcriptional activator [Golovinomyces cichoracearum]